MNAQHFRHPGYNQAHIEHRGMAALVAGAALYATMHGGGAIDKAADPFQDAGEVTRAALSDPADVPLEQQEIDGIPFKDFPKSAQNEWRHEEAAREAGTERVARTMSDLDGHNYAQVHQRAEQFRAEHANDIMPEAQRESIIEIMEAAQTNDEVVRGLQQFMSFYGKGAAFLLEDQHSIADDGTNYKIDRFDKDVAVGDTRDVAEAVVNAYAHLPREMIEGANFRRVLIGKGNGFTGGELDGNGFDNDIVLVTRSRAARTVMRAANFAPDAVLNEHTTETDALHELAHALQADEGGDGTINNAATFPHFGRDLIGIPEDVSQYAAIATSRVEADAEEFSAAFNPEESFATPDETRRFGSPANANVLQKLSYYENQYPGLTDHMADLQNDLK